MATLRILLAGQEAVDLFRDLRVPRKDAFWTVNSFSVQESLRLVAEGTFDAVLISAQVEGMAGLEVAASIRLQNASSPILLLGEDAPSSDEVQRVEGLEYIAPSIDRKLLVRFIELTAQGHRLRLENQQLRKTADRARYEALSAIDLRPARKKAAEKPSAELVGSSAAVRRSCG